MPTKPGSRADKQKGRQDLSYRPSCLVIGKDYFLAAAFLSVPLLATPVHAAGDGGSDTPNCTGGKVWDKAKKKCVDPQRGMIDDDSIYETGRDLAMAGRYGEAITVLSLAADKSDPRILNYLGYSHRKAGRVLVGLGYYREALIRDPGNYAAIAGEGAAMVEKGAVERARRNLAQLESLCGGSCPETRALATAIAQGPRSSKVLTAEAVMPDAVVTQNLSGEAQISSANSATTAR